MTYYGEQAREYQRNRIRARRRAWIESQGSRCTLCGSTERLEIDHIDYTKKEYPISQIWQRSEILKKELLKCRLLCHSCHLEKTRIERFRHGVRGYRLGCRCEICSQAKKVARRRDYIKYGR